MASLIVLWTTLNWTKSSGCPDAGSLYKKYSLMGEKHISSFVTNHNLFSLWIVSNSTLVETEQLIYPWTFPVAEFGGALCLFLGISFMTLHDLALIKNCD